MYFFFLSFVDSSVTKRPTPRENKYRRDYTIDGQQILLLYGTEYGFSEEVATKLFDRYINTASSIIDARRIKTKKAIVNTIHN